jgi:hypothetical protein
MANKQSQARYDGGGQVKYLVYRSPQPLRNGRTQERTRVKRLYFPADATEIRVEDPAELTNRTGRKVHGVAVHYRYQLGSAPSRRGRSTRQTPRGTRSNTQERWSDRTQVVELPRQAKSVRLATKPPEGARMAVS